MRERVAPGDVRAQKDFNKVIAAVEFSADATMNATRFCLQGYGHLCRGPTNTMAAPLADMRSKWKLASAPYEGGKLFGAALDSVLVENKDRKKVLPSRKSDLRQAPLFRRRSFRSSDAGFGTHRFQKAYTHRNRQPDRFGFKDRLDYPSSTMRRSVSGFHEKDGKQYCRQDFYELFSTRCQGCSQAILENYISALNALWHPECFVCRECYTPFMNGSFFEHGGRPFCEIHYHKQRGSLCSGCEKPITGRCITAMGRKFHPEHFVCAFCLKQLNKGTFKEQNEKPYCHPCFIKLFG